MAYNINALLDLLSQEFEFDRDSASEFGWCFFLDAVERRYHRTVRLYYPTQAAWDKTASRKLLTTQFRDFDNLDEHPCLPAAIDFLEGKKAAGGIVLITDRPNEANLMEGERNGDTQTWLKNDTFDYPQKLGAIRKFSEAMSLLHGSGMVLGSLGTLTISVTQHGKLPVLKLDLLTFGDLNAEGDTSKVMFEPAFMVPEKFQGGPSNERFTYSKNIDVYSMAKFFLYFLLGPASFLSLFFDISLKEAAREGSLKKQYEKTTWTNLARDPVELDAKRIEDLSGQKLKSELIELLRLAVSNRPESRQIDAQVFFHGLSTTMVGDVGVKHKTNTDRKGREITPTKEKSSTMNWVLAGLLLLMTLAAIAWYFYDQDQKEKLRILSARTKQTCELFLNNMEKLEPTFAATLPAWPELKSVEANVISSKSRTGILEESLARCRAGNASITQLTTSAVNLLSTEITALSEIFTDVSIDLPELDDSAEDGNATDPILHIINLEETEASLRATLDAHSLELLSAASDTLEQAISLAKQPQFSEVEAQLTFNLKRLVAASPESEMLLERIALSSEITQHSGQILSSGRSALIDTLTQLSTALAGEGADRLVPEFSGAKSNLDLLAEAEQPATQQEYQPVFTALDEINVTFEKASDALENLKPQIQTFTQNIVESLSDAKTNGWDAEAGIAQLRLTFEGFVPSSLFQDWTRLGDLQKLLSAEMSETQADWANGISQCQTFSDKLNASGNVKDTSMWPSLSGILDAISVAEAGNFTRDVFERCVAGIGITDLAINEIMALDLLGELKLTREGLLEAGVGDFITEFSDAATLHDELLQVGNPQSAGEMTAFSDKARVVLEGYDAASMAFTQAQDLHSTLTAEFLGLSQKIKAAALFDHPAFITVQAQLVDADQGHVLTQNLALQKNINAYLALLEQFEAGLLILCNFDSYPMRVYGLASGQLGSNAETVISTAQQGQVAINLVGGSATSFCLSDHPVTYAEMQTFKAGLTSREMNIDREIEYVTETSEGYAQNISYWLASRFAQSVSDQVGQDVCVAPLLATTFARTNYPDIFSVDTNGELFSDTCEGNGGTGKYIIVSGQTVESLNIGCVSNASRRPMLTFRLASGEVCN